jgi:hypothetical protein
MGGRRGFFGVDGGPPFRLKIPAQALETASELPLLPSTSATTRAIDLRAPSPYTARAESMIRKQPVFPQPLRQIGRQDMLFQMTEDDGDLFKAIGGHGSA